MERDIGVEHGLVPFDLVYLLELGQVFIPEAKAVKEQFQLALLLFLLDSQVFVQELGGFLVFVVVIQDFIVPGRLALEILAFPPQFLGQLVQLGGNGLWLLIQGV